MQGFGEEGAVEGLNEFGADFQGGLAELGLAEFGLAEFRFADVRGGDAGVVQEGVKMIEGG